MRLFQPLKYRETRVLWTGQIFSSIGDEIYKVALIWLAASLLGPKAGYIAALQFAAVFLFGILGGKWIDRSTAFRTMIFSDLLRAVFVMLPPVCYFYFGNQLWLLCTVAILVAGPSAFFDPALQSCFARLPGDRKLVHSTNALFDSTKRFARILGPGIVGILSTVVSTIQFFTIDAFSFLISALSISMLSKKLQNDDASPRKITNESIFTNFRHTWNLAFRSPYVLVRTLTCSVGWAMWYFAVGLALPLYLNSKSAGQIDTYAYVLTAYGFGNVVSNLYFSGFETRFAARMIFGGAGLVGLGIFLLPFFSSTVWMMLMAALAAFGGPMDDLFLIRSVQAEYSPKEMARVLRFFMSLSQGLTLLVFLVSPFIFERFSPRLMVAVAGILMCLPNIFALICFRNETLPPN